VENYGVKVDKKLHKEVLERSKALDIAPYAGFMNPHYKPVIDKNDEIIDIVITYSDDFVEQMLYYDKYFSFLPLENN
jgi:dipeptidyl-peptidase-3